MVLDEKVMMIMIIIIIIIIITGHPEGNMNFCSKFHGNLSDPTEILVFRVNQ